MYFFAISKLHIGANPHVGLLFIAIGPQAARLRVNGTARLFEDHPDLAVLPGAQLIVEVTPTEIFANCGRYIPTADCLVAAAHLPKADAAPLEPTWKANPTFKEVVPKRRG